MNERGERRAQGERREAGGRGGEGDFVSSPSLSLLTEREWARCVLKNVCDVFNWNGVQGRRAFTQAPLSGERAGGRAPGGVERVRKALSQERRSSRSPLSSPLHPPPPSRKHSARHLTPNLFFSSHSSVTRKQAHPTPCAHTAPPPGGPRARALTSPSLSLPLSLSLSLSPLQKTKGGPHTESVPSSIPRSMCVFPKKQPLGFLCVLRLFSPYHPPLFPPTPSIFVLC